jgi:hypothetical protein
MAARAPKTAIDLQGKLQRPTEKPTFKLPIPPALALVAAAGLGIFSLAKTKKPVYYTVEEGDTLCTIGECYSRDYRDVFDMNKEVVEDPDIIYPGDRCACCNSEDCMHAL